MAQRNDRIARGSLVVKLVQRGWRPPPLSDEQADRLLHDMQSMHPLRTNDLTRGELEALRLAADGLTAVESAKRIGIEAVTVGDRLSRARLRLGAANTAHAVALAMREGLIR